MLFTELRFIAFFALVFCVHWAVRSHRFRKSWLLLASYAFYAVWNWKFLSLILFSTALDFLVGIALSRTEGRRGRRLLLAASLVGNLGVLAIFKYLNFFIESAVDLAHLFGFEASHRTLAIVLPVGISFYTFQTLSYTIDVYRKRMPETRSLLDFALFVGFFPQLVAGPIVRASSFLPQLVEPRSFPRAEVRTWLTLFLVGFFKKACVSDNVALVVDDVFADPNTFATGARWLAGALYAVQIYCDFSGYTDMALATAGLLGYRLTVNFEFPYLRSSITEFWRAWHISLSTWFRDYLYVPLGGNRNGPFRTYRNLFVVFLLCGLWHGESWNFVVWGLYHGAFLVLERLWLGGALARCPKALAVLWTFAVVVVGWIFFRSADLSTAAAYLRGMFVPTGGEAVASSGIWLALLGGLALLHLATRRVGLDGLPRTPSWLYAIGYGIAVALVLPWVATDYQPFIYFQF